MFNQTVHVLSKLSQTIARESGESNASTEMNSLLQICFDKLHHVQECLPITLKRNKTMLGQLQKFEDGLQKFQQWLNEAKQLISRYSLQVPVKRIDDFLEQHRVSSLICMNPKSFVKHELKGVLKCIRVTFRTSQTMTDILATIHRRPRSTP
jgi:hypothetical protein